MIRSAVPPLPPLLVLVLVLPLLVLVLLPLLLPLLVLLLLAAVVVAVGVAVAVKLLAQRQSSECYIGSSSPGARVYLSSLPSRSCPSRCGWTVLCSADSGGWVHPPASASA